MPWLSFLNPAYLGALALVAIPLALHLHRRRKVRDVTFSDLRFLREAIVKQQRRLQVENRRLLLLRILVFLLLVLAVSKPVLKLARTSLVKEGDHSASVIILDNSYSMGCIENGVVRFDRAKQLALEILEGLREKDRVTLILASTLAEVLYRDLPVTHFETETALQASEVSYRASDLAQALALAEGFLREAKADHREVYVITDLQRAAFENVLPALSGDRKPIDLYLLSVGYPDTGNLALTESEIQPKRVAPGGECHLTFKGFAFGEIEPGFASLVLQGAGRGLTETSVPVKPGTGFSKSFVERLGEEGSWLALARVEDQALAADNERYLVVPIDQPARALLIEGDPHMRKADWDTFYFERALKIYSSGLSGGRSYEVFQQGVQDELSKLEPGGFDLIVLANVPRVSREIVRKLKTFVEEGGQLMIAFGSRVDLQSYNDRMVPQPIPFPLKRVVKSGQRPPYHIAAFQDKKGPLQLFSKSEHGDLTLPLFWEYISLEARPDSGAEVLAQLETGAVVLFEFPIGRGKVIGWASSLDADWNNFPQQPLYLPFWGEVLDYLDASSAPMPNFEVGDTVEITVDFGPDAAEVTSVQILLPNGELESVEVDPGQGRFRAYFSATSWPGFYRLHIPDRQGIQKVDPEVFAVNVSPKESDLSRVADEEIAAKLAGWNLKRIGEPRKAAGVLAGARQGRPLWDLLLLLLFLGILGETIYANRIWR